VRKNLIFGLNKAKKRISRVLCHFVYIFDLEELEKPSSKRK